MIAIHTLAGLLQAGGLVLAKAAFNSGEASPNDGLRQTVIDHVRQLRADWDGQPEAAEHIYRIVNSTLGA